MKAFVLAAALLLLHAGTAYGACSERNSASGCTSCVDIDGGSVCVYCDTTKGWKYQSIDEACECADGYTRNAAGSACDAPGAPLACTDIGCTACAAGPDICTACATGFTLESGVCVARSDCVDAGCADCSADPAVCLACDDDFNLVAGACVPVTPPKPCSPGCAVCDYTSGYCKRCRAGKYMNKGRCTAVRPKTCRNYDRNCKACSKRRPLKCAACKRGFRLNNRGRCVRKYRG